jgi:hypothetical protein
VVLMLTHSMLEKIYEKVFFFIHLLKGSFINDSDSRKFLLGKNRYDLISYMIYFGCTLCEYMQSKINSIMQMRFKFFINGSKQFLHQPQKLYFMFSLEKYIRQACKFHTGMYRPTQARTSPYRPIQADTGPYRLVQAFQKPDNSIL